MTELEHKLLTLVASDEEREKIIPLFAGPDEDDEEGLDTEDGEEDDDILDSDDDSEDDLSSDVNDDEDDE